MRPAEPTTSTRAARKGLSLVRYQIEVEAGQVEKADLLVLGIALSVGGILLIILGIINAVGSVWSPSAPSIRPAFLAFVAFWIGLIVTVIGILVTAYGLIAEQKPQE